MPNIITGTNDPTRDVPAVQSAVSMYDDIVLRGRFHFGDGSAFPRQTVAISKGVRIRGETATDPSGNTFSWSTEILGGGASLPSSFGQSDSGAFKVMNKGAGQGGDDKAVVFEGISFRNWKGEAIFAEACQGLEVRNCKFTQPAPGTLVPEFQMVHAIFAGTHNCTGRFVAERNFGLFGDYRPLPDDEQLLACFLSCFGSISIAGNDINGHDAGIEVLFNGLYNQDPAFRPTISIRDNSISLMQVVGEKWPGHCGILCVNNPKSVPEICDNKISETGPGVALLLSGERFTVSHNHSNQAPLDANDVRTYPIAALAFGCTVTMPGFPADLGPSLNDSVVSNNDLSGTALFGMMTYDANPDPSQPVLPLNRSHGIDASGNNMESLVSSVATVDLTKGTHDNVFKGSFRSVIDMGTNNLITGFPERKGPISAGASEAIRMFAESVRARVGAMANALH